MTRLCTIRGCNGRAVHRGRCALHRRTTTQRGYGAEHQRARTEKGRTLPRLCEYGCGTVLTRDGVWVLAHRVDGRPEFGYLASCVTCNERAKGSTGGEGARRDVEPLPNDPCSFLAVPTGSRFVRES